MRMNAARAITTWRWVKAGQCGAAIIWSAWACSESRLRTVSHGEERPAATGSDETAWARNRRAVTVMIDCQ